MSINGVKIRIRDFIYGGIAFVYLYVAIGFLLAMEG